MSIRLFVDMDGTLAVFRPVTEIETLYEEGYFLNLEPQKNVVEGIREIIKTDKEVEVFILSSYLLDSAYALQEKQEWLDKHLPEVKEENRLFIPCGIPKKEALSGLVSKEDVLLDDYTKNLLEWHPPGTGIKLLNGINHTKGTWKEERISSDRPPLDFAAMLSGVLHKKMILQDQPPKSSYKQVSSVPDKNQRPRMKL